MSENKILLFVWGTLKKGYINHDYYMKNAKFIDYGITKEAKFIRTGFITTYYLPDTEKELERIYGEVYEITEEDLKEIDRLEGYPYLYNRSLMDIELLNKKEIVKAWMYWLPNSTQIY